MRVTALASGSSGNAYLIQAGTTAVLVDAGITLVQLGAALASAGLTIPRLTCLLLTHEHSDHLSSAAALSRRHGLPVLATPGTLAYLPGCQGERIALAEGARLSMGELAVTPFAVPHDGAEPVGYLLEHEGVRVCLATDLGHVPRDLLPVLRTCDLLVLEANHDWQRLWQGPYPLSLKQRVAAPTGHLSNEQAAACLIECASGGPQWVWLAHLSATNNSPRFALRAVTARLHEAQVRTLNVQVALRDRPSLTWHSAKTYYQPPLL